MSIKLVTFKTNHTIIGEVKTEGDSVIISKPVQVVVQATQNGPVMGFVPFIDYCKEFESGIVFYQSDILTINTPILELENSYNKNFGSGIEVVASLVGV